MEFWSGDEVLTLVMVLFTMELLILSVVVRASGMGQKPAQDVTKRVGQICLPKNAIERCISYIYNIYIYIPSGILISFG